MSRQTEIYHLPAGEYLFRVDEIKRLRRSEKWRFGFVAWSLSVAEGEHVGAQVSKIVPIDPDKPGWVRDQLKYSGVSGASVKNQLAALVVAKGNLVWGKVTHKEGRQNINLLKPKAAADDGVGPSTEDVGRSASPAAVGISPAAGAGAEKEGA